MMRTVPFLALFAATGCHHHANVGYLQAADVTVDPDVQTVLVIDRSGARNFGEHALAGMEGAASGETYMLDAESAAFAIDALEGVLEDGPRFEVVRFRVNGRQVDTTLWDRELTARKVRQLCRKASCDAIIALETFDSDQLTELSREGEAYTAAERREARANGECEDRRCEGDFDYVATQHTEITGTFRMYDGRTGAILDEQHAALAGSDTGVDADDPGEAVADLPLDGRVLTGAAELGAQYGMRVSPHTVIGERRLFGTGSQDMRRARKAMKHGDLATAKRLWNQVLRDDAKLAGKALHNLAVVAEAEGNLGKAVRLARRAHARSGKRATARYLRTLSQRRHNDERVAMQLAGVDRS